MPFKEHYGVIMLLASVIEIVNFYKHADIITKDIFKIFHLNSAIDVNA